MVVGLQLADGKKEIVVKGVFEDGEMLKDFYSDQNVKVSNGIVKIDSPFAIVLLGK